MLEDWFVATEEAQLGPLTLNEVTDLHREGKINKNTMIWNPSMDDWDEAQNIEQVCILLGLTKEKPRNSNVIHPQTVQEDEVEWVPSASSLIDLIKEELARPVEEKKEEEEPKEDLGLPELFPTIQQPLSVPQPIEVKKELKQIPGLKIWIVLIVGLVSIPYVFYFRENKSVVEKVVEKTVVKIQPKQEEIVPQPTEPVKEKVSPVKPIKKTKKKKVTPPPPKKELVKLTTKDIVSGVKKNLSTTGKCLKIARRKGELLPGRHKLVLNWTIQPDGSVTNPSMTGPSSLMNTVLPGCMKKVMMKWRFKKSSEPAEVKNFPFGPFKVS